MMTQLDLPFVLDPDTLRTFLARWCALEDEQARLREEQGLLRKRYEADLPLRAVLTAVKVLRARRRLETHATEPLSLVHQEVLEALIDGHLVALDLARFGRPVEVVPTGEAL